MPERSAAQEQADQTGALLFFGVAFLGAAITLASLIYPVTAIVTSLLYALFIFIIHKAFIATFPFKDQHDLFTYAIFAAIIPTLILGGQMFKLERHLARNWLFWTFRHCWRLVACATWVFFLFGALRGDITMSSFESAAANIGMAPFQLFSMPLETPWDVLEQLMSGIKLTSAMGLNMLHLVWTDLSGMHDGTKDSRWMIEAGWALGTAVILNFMLFFSWRRSLKD